MVRLAPDAWASRTLLLHIDRRHHHNAGAIVSRMVLKVQTQDYRATTKQTSFSLVHAPFSIPLRTFPPYTRVAPNTAEVSRGTVVLGQGFLRTVRRLDEWGGDSGDAVLHYHTRNSRRHFLVSSIVNCFLSSIQIHTTSTISVFHHIYCSLFIVQQRQSRSNGPHVIIRN
jgi:hypothetical protein